MERTANTFAKRLLTVLLAVFLLAGLWMPLGASSAFAADEPLTKETPIADLNGKTLGVQTAVLYEELIKDRCPDSEFLFYTLPNDMIPALNAGKVAAYLMEEVGYYAQKVNHPELEKMDELAGVAYYAIVIGNDVPGEEPMQARLTAELNQFIHDMEVSGERDEMYEYWIKNFDANTSTCDITQGSGENGTIRIAIEGGYEPFSFITDGHVNGFDVDFMCRFCRAYGYKYEFFEVPFESIAPGAETGKYHVGMNIVVSDERSDTAILTNPYYSCDIYLVIPGEKGEKVPFFRQMKDSFYKTFIKENRWKMFVQGIGVTMLITLCAIAFGTVLGFLVFLLCRRSGKGLRKIVEFINTVIHGMPTVVFIMILYYVIFGRSSLSGMWISVVGFSLIFACAMFDMLHVGCNAVSRGQTEASRALGYTDKESFFKIILPQAARHFLPIARNEVVALIKETSIVGYIAVLDLTKNSDLVRMRTYEAFFPLIATALIYFAIEGLLIWLVSRLQINIDPHRRSQEKILKGIRTEE